jgi:hypothetical protein
VKASARRASWQQPTCNEKKKKTRRAPFFSQECPIHHPSLVRRTLSLKFLQMAQWKDLDKPAGLGKLNSHLGM